MLLFVVVMTNLATPSASQTAYFCATCYSLVNISFSSSLLFYLLYGLHTVFINLKLEKDS